MQRLALLLVIVVSVVDACTLCYVRLPPRPPPVDHLWLSALEQVYLPDTFAEMCNMSNTLPLIDGCRAGFAQLFCALAQFTDYNSVDCRASAPQNCANCTAQKLAILHNTSWTLTWLDSFGKMPSAVSEGNYYWLGDYEQCQQLRRQNQFDGRYCRVLLKIPTVELENGCPQHERLEIHLGVCVPAGCGTNEIALLSQLITPYAVSAECELAQSWSTPSIIFTSLIGFWLFVLIFGTLYEVSNDSEQLCRQKHIQMLAECVSVCQNGECVLSTKRNHDYHSVQGIQVISVCLIITAKCFIYIAPYIENVIFSYESIQKWQLHILNNFSYHVDALIAINTLFTCLVVRKSLNKFDDIKNFYFQRLIQILPSFAFIILFMTLVFQRLSSGPIWMHEDLTIRCKNSWWTNLLFINNLLPTHKTCLDGAYLYSLEVQFFLLLLPMLYLAKDNRTQVLATTVSAMFASIAYIFYQTISHRLPPTLMLTTQTITSDVYQSYIDLIYIKPWTRAPAFFIGFLFSFVFSERFKLSTICVWIIQMLLFVVAAVVVFGLYPYSLASNMPQWTSYILQSLYAATHRLAWAIVVCGLVYFSYHNRNCKGRISQLLEWRIFSPLAKHTLVVFVISEPVSLYLFSSLDRPLHATLWSLLNVALGTIIVSYLFAFALETLVSMPVNNLINLVISLHSWGSKATLLASKQIDDDYTLTATP